MSEITLKFDKDDLRGIVREVLAEATPEPKREYLTAEQIRNLPAGTFLGLGEEGGRVAFLTMGNDKYLFFYSFGGEQPINNSYWTADRISGFDAFVVGSVAKPTHHRS